MPNTELYPLIFKSIPVSKVWGGDNLAEMFNKSIDVEHCGEIWELTTVQDHISVVKSGPLKDRKLTDLINDYQGDLVGKEVFEQFGTEFPLLVKFIDAREDLSIQVHPNDEQAAKYNSLGKSELWYILKAEEGANLITGFERPVAKEEFSERIENNTIQEVLHHEEVSEDDVYYTPAGRIHHIGAGMVLAEIQQSSNITFRIYDYDREDIGGGKRELHIKEAAEVLNFDVVKNGKTAYTPKKNSTSTLVESQYFTVNRLHLDMPILRDYVQVQSFKILMCVSGQAEAVVGKHHFVLNAGDVYLIPAIFEQLSIVPTPEAVLLEAFI